MSRLLPSPNLWIEILQWNLDSIREDERIGGGAKTGVDDRYFEKLVFRAAASMLHVSWFDRDENSLYGILLCQVVCIWRSAHVSKLISLLRIKKKKKKRIEENRDWIKLKIAQEEFRVEIYSIFLFFFSLRGITLNAVPSFLEQDHGDFYGELKGILWKLRFEKIRGT